MSLQCPIWTFVIYLGKYLSIGICQKQCLYVAHMWSYRWKDHDTFETLYGKSYDQIVYEAHIVSHIVIYSCIALNVNILWVSGNGSHLLDRRETGLAIQLFGLLADVNKEYMYMYIYGCVLRMGYDTHLTHIWSSSLHYKRWPWITLKGQSMSLGFS